MPTKLQEATRHKKHTSTHTHTHTVFDRDRSTTEEGIATATQLLRPAAAAAMFDARLLALVATTAASHSQANAPPSVSSFFALIFFFFILFLSNSPSFFSRRFIWLCGRDVPPASTGLIDRTSSPRGGRARRVPHVAAWWLWSQLRMTVI